VAVPVVDPLEVVDVEHEHSDAGPVGAAGEFVFDRFHGR
jgi:hypothetical protein